MSGGITNFVFHCDLDPFPHPTGHHYPSAGLIFAYQNLVARQWNTSSIYTTSFVHVKRSAMFTTQEDLELSLTCILIIPPYYLIIRMVRHQLPIEPDQ